MARYIGDFLLGVTIYEWINSADAPGAALTLAGSPALSVYEGGNATEFTTGATITADYDSKTGMAAVVIDTSSGYSAGKEYAVWLTAGSVDGVSQVNMIVLRFSIQNRYIGANVVQWLGTAPSAPTIAGVPKVDLALIGGDLQSGLDAKDFFDAGYDPGTNNLTDVRLANLDATVGSRATQTSVDDVQTDVTTLLSDTFDIVSMLSTISGVLTTITNRIGAFTGSGVNTILGAFKALLSKVASTPSDIGGTFDPAADSVEAVSEAVAAIKAVTDKLASLAIASGTIGATGNDTTHLHLDGLLFTDDALNDCLIVVTDVSTGLLHGEWISDWDLSDELATMDATLPFTPQASTDTYVVYAIRKDVTAGGGGGDCDPDEIAQAVAALLAGEAITIRSAVQTDGSIRLIRNFDYLNADGRAVLFADSTWPVLTSGSVRLTVLQTAGTGMGTKIIDAQAGTITAARACYFEIDKDDTADQAVGKKYRYQVEATLSNGHVVPLEQGDLELQKNYSDELED